MKKTFQKIIATVLTSGIALASIAIPASAAAVTDFTDVKTGSWYYDAVEYAADNGLFSGTSNSTFSPNGGMTRGMFVAVLGRKAGVKESDYLRYRFDDVKVGDYYAPFVEWAATYGIVSGTGEKKFSPNGKITREQMAAILYRYAEKTENDTTFSDEAYKAFPDSTSVSDYAQEAFKWATSQGIINGSDGKLQPKGTATRAQVAQVFLGSKDVLVSTKITADPILPPPEPSEPKIVLTPEQKAKLASTQDPDKILELVDQFNAMDAKWDDTISGSTVHKAQWGDLGLEDHTSEQIALGFYQAIDRTGADKFYITVEDFNPQYAEEYSVFTCYYNVPEKEDSAALKEVKERIKSYLPAECQWDESMIDRGGWRGPISNRDGCTEKDGTVYKGNDYVAFYSSKLIVQEPVVTYEKYCITEPRPGEFYCFYGF